MYDRLEGQVDARAHAEHKRRHDARLEELEEGHLLEEILVEHDGELDLERGGHVLQDVVVVERLLLGEERLVILPTGWRARVSREDGTAKIRIVAAGWR